MKTAWCKGLSAEKKESMKNAFSSSADIRERLILLIQEKVQTNRTKRRQDSAYESPNWAYQQADSCGYERALEEITSLLT